VGVGKREASRMMLIRKKRAKREVRGQKGVLAAITTSQNPFLHSSWSQRPFHGKTTRIHQHFFFFGLKLGSAIWPILFIFLNKYSFIGTEPHPFIYLSVHGCFLLK
jgi:hypothetical protein